MIWLRLVDSGYRQAFRCAWPIVSLARRFYRTEGVGVALWVEDRLLVVRHSYKPGLAMPGGGVKTMEKDYKITALRELREEVGVELKASDLVFKFTKRFPGSRAIAHLYEAHLAARPRAVIDGREIIYAEFLTPEQIIASGCGTYFYQYLRSCATERCTLELDKTPETAII